MILYYLFDNIVCRVPHGAGTHIDNGWYEPHYREEICEVDYEHEVDVKFEDFFDFMKPHGFDKWAEDGRFAYERACRDMWNSDWFDLYSLEENEDFIDFMTDKYEREARYECEDRHF